MQIIKVYDLQPIIKKIASLIWFALIKISYSAPKDPTDPTTYNLPADYIYTEKEFGTFFYKSRGRQDASRADASCRADGARLPVPRTLAENNFYASLAGNQVWLGVNDKAKEGTWADTEGKPVSWTLFGPGEPNNAGRGEDIVHINGMKWNDHNGIDFKETICVYYPDRINEEDDDEDDEPVDGKHLTVTLRAEFCLPKSSKFEFSAIKYLKITPMESP